MISVVAEKPRLVGERSLASRRPDLAQQWHPSRNGDVTPEHVTFRSGKKFWWVCAEGHEWDATPDNRFSKGCPYCSNKRVDTRNSLVATHPHLAGEWHPTANGSLTPNDDVVAGTNRVLWWQCEAGHDYQQMGAVRLRGHGCPYCSGRHATPEDNLLVRFPDLARQWHPTKNGQLRPGDVKPFSPRKAWWVCATGHEWEATLGNRAKGTGCPKCSGRVVTPTTSLAALRPEIAAQWDPERNAPTSPDQVRPGSARAFWWHCSLGHKWLAAVAARASGRGCPVCTSRRVSPDTSMATVRPDLAAEWHPTRNGDLTPHEVLPATNRRLWWMCERGHEWQAQGNNRYSGGRCPYCQNRKVADDNCLTTTHPGLAAQWHPTLNGNLQPFAVTYGTSQRIWWICSLGHEWEDSANNRTSGGGSGCPFCSRRRVSSDNCMAVTHPHIASQWHPTRNGKLTPSDVLVGTNRSIWWLCATGHEWKARGNDRLSGFGCPFCSNRQVDANNCLAATHPELASEWHPTRNGTLTPFNVVGGTGIAIWWKCARDHEWCTTANARTTSGTGCSDCASGFRFNAPAMVYLVTTGEAHKIGIAGDGRRTALHERYGWRTVMRQWVPSGLLARRVELRILAYLRRNEMPPHYAVGAMPQGGETETVSATAISVEALVALIEETVEAVVTQDPQMGVQERGQQARLF